MEPTNFEMGGTRPEEYESGESGCCGAKVYYLDGEFGICADCEEHCNIISKESIQIRDSIAQIHKNYPNINHGPGSRCPIEFCSKCKEVDNI